MAAWTDRNFRSPDADFLTPDQLRGLLGLPVDVFERLERDGVLPAPIKMSQRTILYTWRQATYAALWLELFGDKDHGKGKTPGRESGASGG